jgi:hypothetical protein
MAFSSDLHLVNASRGHEESSPLAKDTPQVSADLHGSRRDLVRYNEPSCLVASVKLIARSGLLLGTAK